MALKKLTFYSLAILITFSFVTSDRVVANDNSESQIVYEEVDAPSLKALDKVRLGVYLPPNYSEMKSPLPVIYYLSGFGQNEKSWDEMGIKGILDNLIVQEKVPPMIVVSPGSENTGWLNWYNGEYDWEDFLRKDLVKLIDKKYNTVQNSCGRGISGNSMGGIGALAIGFKNRQVFGSISSHSGAIHPTEPSMMPGWAKNWDGWNTRMGKPIDVYFWRQNNPISIAEMFSNFNQDENSIYFDVGEKDQLGFAKTNAMLSNKLKELKIPHEFFIRPGKHGSQFVKDNARFALEFHAKKFQECIAKG